MHIDAIRRVIVLYENMKKKIDLENGEGIFNIVRNFQAASRESHRRGLLTTHFARSVFCVSDSVLGRRVSTVKAAEPI